MTNEPAARGIVRGMLRASLREVPKEPEEIAHPAIAFLDRLADIAAEAIQSATIWTDLAPYQRARMRHLGVAIAATVADLQRGLK